MSRKIGFLNDFRADDFSRGKGKDFVIFVSTLDLRFRALSQHRTSAKNIQHCQMKSSLFSKNPRKNNNIGSPALCKDNLSGIRPQDVVALDNVYNGKFNLARMSRRQCPFGCKNAFVFLAYVWQSR